MVYTYKSADFNIQAFTDEVFTYKVLKDENCSYLELKQQGVPLGRMDKDVLSLSPDHPRGGNNYHPLTLHGNFI